jgi:hypothetical protein
LYHAAAIISSLALPSPFTPPCRATINGIAKYDQIEKNQFFGFVNVFPGFTGVVGTVNAVIVAQHQVLIHFDGFIDIRTCMDKSTPI